MIRLICAVLSILCMLTIVKAQSNGTAPTQTTQTVIEPLPPEFTFRDLPAGLFGIDLSSKSAPTSELKSGLKVDLPPALDSLSVTGTNSAEDPTRFFAREIIYPETAMVNAIRTGTDVLIPNTFLGSDEPLETGPQNNQPITEINLPTFKSELNTTSLTSSGTGKFPSAIGKFPANDGILNTLATGNQTPKLGLGTLSRGFLVNENLATNLNTILSGGDVTKSPLDKNTLNENPSVLDNTLIELHPPPLPTNAKLSPVELVEPPLILPTEHDTPKAPANKLPSLKLVEQPLILPVVHDTTPTPDILPLSLEPLASEKPTVKPVSLLSTDNSTKFNSTNKNIPDSSLEVVSDALVASTNSDKTAVTTTGNVILMNHTLPVIPFVSNTKIELPNKSSNAVNVLQESITSNELSQNKFNNAALNSIEDIQAKINGDVSSGPSSDPRPIELVNENEDIKQIDNSRVTNIKQDSMQNMNVLLNYPPITQNFLTEKPNDLIPLNSINSLNETPIQITDTGHFLPLPVPEVLLNKNALDLKTNKPTITSQSNSIFKDSPSIAFNNPSSPWESWLQNSIFNNNGDKTVDSTVAQAIQNTIDNIKKLDFTTAAGNGISLEENSDVKTRIDNLQAEIKAKNVIIPPVLAESIDEGPKVAKTESAQAQLVQTAQVNNLAPSKTSEVPLTNSPIVAAGTIPQEKSVPETPRQNTINTLQDSNLNIGGSNNDNFSLHRRLMLPASRLGEAIQLLQGVTSGDTRNTQLQNQFIIDEIKPVGDKDSAQSFFVFRPYFLNGGNVNDIMSSIGNFIPAMNGHSILKQEPIVAKDSASLSQNKDKESVPVNVGARISTTPLISLPNTVDPITGVQISPNTIQQIPDTIDTTTVSNNPGFIAPPLAVSNDISSNTDVQISNEILTNLMSGPSSFLTETPINSNVLATDPNNILGLTQPLIPSGVPGNNNVLTSKNVLGLSQSQNSGSQLGLVQPLIPSSVPRNGNVLGLAKTTNSGSQLELNQPLMPSDVLENNDVLTPNSVLGLSQSQNSGSQLGLVQPLIPSSVPRNDNVLGLAKTTNSGSQLELNQPLMPSDVLENNDILTPNSVLGLAQSQNSGSQLGLIQTFIPSNVPGNNNVLGLAKTTNSGSQLELTQPLIPTNADGNNNVLKLGKTPNLGSKLEINKPLISSEVTEINNLLGQVQSPNSKSQQSDVPGNNNVLTPNNVLGLASNPGLLDSQRLTSFNTLIDTTTGQTGVLSSGQSNINHLELPSEPKVIRLSSNQLNSIKEGSAVSILDSSNGIQDNRVGTVTIANENGNIISTTNSIQLADIGRSQGVNTAFNFPFMNHISGTSSIDTPSTTFFRNSNVPLSTNIDRTVAETNSVISQNIQSPVHSTNNQQTIRNSIDSPANNGDVTLGTNSFVSPQNNDLSFSQNSAIRTHNVFLDNSLESSISNERILRDSNSRRSPVRSDQSLTSQNIGTHTSDINNRQGESSLTNINSQSGNINDNQTPPPTEGPPLLPGIESLLAGIPDNQIAVINLDDNFNVASVDRVNSVNELNFRQNRIFDPETFHSDTANALNSRNLNERIVSSAEPSARENTIPTSQDRISSISNRRSQSSRKFPSSNTNSQNDNRVRSSQSDLHIDPNEFSFGTQSDLHGIAQTQRNQKDASNGIERPRNSAREITIPPKRGDKIGRTRGNIERTTTNDITRENRNRDINTRTSNIRDNVNVRNTHDQVWESRRRNNRIRNNRHRDIGIGGSDSSNIGIPFRDINNREGRNRNVEETRPSDRNRETRRRENRNRDAWNRTNRNRDSRINEHRNRDRRVRNERNRVWENRGRHDRNWENRAGSGRNRSDRLRDNRPNSARNDRNRDPTNGNRNRERSNSNDNRNNRNREGSNINDNRSNRNIGETPNRNRNNRPRRLFRTWEDRGNFIETMRRILLHNARELRTRNQL